jgi:hypothetical protein
MIAFSDEIRPDERGLVEQMKQLPGMSVPTDLVFPSHQIDNRPSNRVVLGHNAVEPLLLFQRCTARSFST